MFEKPIPFLGTHTCVLILQRKKYIYPGNKVNILVLVKRMAMGRAKPNPYGLILIVVFIAVWLSE